MNKILIQISALLILCNIMAQYSIISNMDQLYDILSKDKKAIILMSQNQRNDVFQNTHKNIQNIIENHNLQDYYEVKISNCQQFEALCQLEKLQEEKQIIFIAAKYDNMTFQFDEINQLEDYIKVNVKTINTLQEYQQIIQDKSNSYSILFSTDMQDNVDREQVNNYIRKCISDIFDPKLVTNYFKIDLKNLKEYSDQKYQLKNEDQKILFFIIKNGEIQKVPMQNPTYQDFLNYVNIDIVKDVQKMTKENFVKIFNYPLNHKIFFFNKNLEENQCDRVYDLLKKAQQHNMKEDLLSQRILFVEVQMPAESEESKFFIERFLGQQEIEDHKCYLIAQLHIDHEDFKYSLEVNNKTTLDEILQFKNKFLERKIENLYLKSEKLEDENQKWNDTNLDKIVSQNFEEKIKENNADYFLMLIESSEDVNSQILIYFMNLLKQKLPDLQMGVMDYNKNETPLLKTQAFPTFLYYHQKAKHQPAFYAEDFSYQQLIQFLNQNSNSKVDFDQDLKLKFLEYLKQVRPEDTKMIEEYILNTDEL